MFHKSLEKISFPLFFSVEFWVKIDYGLKLILDSISVHKNTFLSNSPETEHLATIHVQKISYPKLVKVSGIR